MTLWGRVVDWQEVTGSVQRGVEVKSDVSRVERQMVNELQLELRSAVVPTAFQ